MNIPQPGTHGPQVNAGGGGGTAAVPKHSVPKVKVKSKGKGKKKGNKPDYAYLSTPLSEQELAQHAKAASKLKYGQQFRDIGNELNISHTMQNRIGNWYDNYRRDINKSARGTEGFYNQASHQLQNFANQGQSRDTAIQGLMNLQAQKDAALRGTTVDASVARTGAQATAARRGVATAQLGNLLAHGGADVGYLRKLSANTQAQAIAAHQEEAGRARKLRKDRRALHGEQGEYRTTYGDTLRQNERNFKLALETLGVNKEKAAAAAALAGANASETARHHRETEKEARQRAKLTKRGQDISASKGGSKGGSGGSSSGGHNGFTSTQIHSAKSKLRSYTGQAEAYRRANPHATQQQAYHWMLSKFHSVDPVMAYAASQRAYFGGVGKKTREQLWRGYGFHVPLFSSHGGGGLGGVPR